MEDDEDRPKRPSRTQSAVISEDEVDDRETDLDTEKMLFTLLIFCWEIFMLIIYIFWVEYEPNEIIADHQVVTYYDYFRFFFSSIFHNLCFPTPFFWGGGGVGLLKPHHTHNQKTKTKNDSENLEEKRERERERDS